MFLAKLFATASLLALAAGCGVATNGSSGLQEAWNPSNDPLNIGDGYDRSLASLPTEASLETTPWTDSYWPSQHGGIAYRWLDATGADAWTYASPSLDELRQMAPAQLARLSPAEKLDIVNGDFSYPTVSTERRRTKATAASWEGICHGWSPAAINFNEPKSVVMPTRDGLALPFGSSDVKALLSYYQGQVVRGRVRFLGSRCNIDLARFPERALDPACRDTNAGAFHVVLANQIGVRKEAFNADVTRDLEVWNQPVHGFRARLVDTHGPSEGAAPGTVEEKVFETEMTYTVEIKPQWGALLGTAGHPNRTKVYKYRIELDAQGQIIGGEWESEDRPDFLWTHSKPVFAGAWTAVESIYAASIASEGIELPVL